MADEGVRFVNNTRVGVDLDPHDLQRDNDAVVFATGATWPRDLKLPNREVDGIHFAMELLTLNTQSLLNSEHADGNYLSAKDKDVIVIGGGDSKHILLPLDTELTNEQQPVMIALVLHCDMVQDLLPISNSCRNLLQVVQVIIHGQLGLVSSESITVILKLLHITARIHENIASRLKSLFLMMKANSRGSTLFVSNGPRIILVHSKWQRWLDLKPVCLFFFLLYITHNYKSLPCPTCPCLLSAS